MAGALNLSARSLTALPPSLFSLHLGIDPEPLKGQPDSSEKDSGAPSSIPFYEAVDLTILKVRGNAIVALQVCMYLKLRKTCRTETPLQPELALFGSLKVIDLHGNALTSFPDQLSELVCLGSLDLSSNRLTSLSQSIVQLPNLITLNLADNALTSCHFQSASRKSGARPLPALQTLHIERNKLTGGSFSGPFPVQLSKLHIQGNPLGADAQTILKSLGELSNLKDLNLSKCALVNASVPIANSDTGFFGQLASLDLTDNETLSEAKVREMLAGRDVAFEGYDDEVMDGDLVVKFGKILVKEAWELDAERRGRGTRVQG